MKTFVAFFVLLSSLWIMSLGQQRCCGTDRYEIIADTVSGPAVESDPSFPPIRMFVDHTKKMMVEQISVHQAGNFTAIFDFKTMIGYTVDFASKTCNAGALYPGNELLVSQCIPANATFIRNVSLGYGGGKIVAKDWMFGKMAPQPGINIEIKSVLETKNCVKILDLATMTTETDTYNTVLLYTDYNPTIKDPSVFNIPAFCKRKGTIDSDAAMLKFYPQKYRVLTDMIKKLAK